MVRDEEISDVVLLPETTIDMLHVMNVAETILDRNYGKNAEHWQTAMFQALRSHRTNLLKRDCNDPAKVSLHEYLNTKLDRFVDDLNNATENGFFNTNNYFNFHDTSLALVNAFRRFTYILNRCDDFVLRSLTDVVLDLKAVEKNLIKCISKLETDTDGESLKLVETNDSVKFTEEGLEPAGNDPFCECCNQKIAVFNNDANFSISLHMQDDEHLRNVITKKTNQIEIPFTNAKCDTEVNLHAVIDQTIPSNMLDELKINNDGTNNGHKNSKPSSVTEPTTLGVDIEYSKLPSKQDEEYSSIMTVKVSKEQNLPVKSDKFSIISLEKDSKEIDVVECAHCEMKRIAEKEIHEQIRSVVPDAHVSSIIVVDAELIVCILCICPLTLESVREHVKERQHEELYQARKVNGILYQVETTDIAIIEEKESRLVSKSEWCYVNIPKRHPNINVWRKTIDSSEEFEIRVKIINIARDQDVLFKIFTPRSFVCLLCVRMVSMITLERHISGEEHAKLYNLYLNEVSNTSSRDIMAGNLCSLCVCKRVTFKNTTLHLHSIKDINKIEKHHSNDTSTDDNEELTDENTSKCVEQVDQVLEISPSKISVINLV